MSDSEKLTADTIDDGGETESVVNDNDDLSGMAVGMVRKLDLRELLILWVGFLFLHTEMFSTMFLKRFNGATHGDGSTTMKGTIYSSIFMILLVVLCSFIF